MSFAAEAEPRRLVKLPVRPGVWRIVAPNPGPLTYHGTNTWLLETDDGLWVIDPGPADDAHIAAVAGAGPIARILLTHTHADHAAGARALRALTGAPVYGWGRPWARDFSPDIALANGEVLGPLTVLHTPGHASDHLCFAHADGALFSGDHVMGWSTSVIIPPDGDMAAYMAGLAGLLARADTLYLPGHGPPVENPRALVRGMLTHRAAREAAVRRALGDVPRSPAEIAAMLYASVASTLLPAAARTVQAHLLKLEAEGRAVAQDGGWVAP